MCGIVGMISKKVEKDKAKIIRPMLKTMEHRGPDGQGLHESEQAVLAMRRLAIIDIEGASQPIYNEDKKITIVANGEIYNYLELQKTLIKKGHQFSTQGDIETIVHLFEDKGIKLLSELVGMYAFALLDSRENVLYLVRDRYGEKPLYYTFTDQGLFFASELKTILKTPKIDKQFNNKAIKEYFYNNYVLEPHTVFSSINKIPAGHYLKLDLNTFSSSINCYWDFKQIVAKTEKNPEILIKDSLEKACDYCLRSDVPVGISLSGGIDSSAIMAICAKISKKNLTAFSIGYDEKTLNDESIFAEKFSKELGVKYVRKKIATNDFKKFFPHLVYWSDEPVADLAAFGIYSIAKIAKESKVPVLLGGLGGDELFWGYPNFNKIVQKNEFKLPIDNYSLFRQDRIYKNAKKILPMTLTKKYKDIPLFDKKSKIEINSKTELAKQSLDELRKIWLAGNCLTLNDRLSMAMSIESRVPFLDYNLSIKALGCEQNLFAYKSGTKDILKKSLKGILPQEILNRPKKGFSPPSYYWLKKIISTYVGLLENGFLVKEGIIKNSSVKILKLCWIVCAPFWLEIYKLILLEVWMREYCDDTSPEAILDLVNV